MRADLAALLHDADRGVGRELLEADGGGQPGRARAHHEGVELHRFPLLVHGHVSRAFPSDVGRLYRGARLRGTRAGRIAAVWKSWASALR